MVIWAEEDNQQARRKQTAYRSKLAFGHIERGAGKKGRGETKGEERGEWEV